MFDRIIHPLSELPMLFNDAREIGVSIQHLEELMGQADEPSGDWDGSQCVRDCDQVLETVIEFENVNFAYNEDCQVLYNVDFTIQVGKNVAFVGSFGEGKSTIFKLLCGFYKKKSGNYKLYGRNFEDWNLNAARNIYSLVSQNVFLFPESIVNNIANGRQGATMEEIKQACRLANIHDFIITLPQQYDTLAGERGNKSSGGEKQRIAIARAILKNAPIFLLYEATSALDNESEYLVQEAIQSLMKD